MGHRTLKRVALDFSYPLNKVWTGYRNPHTGAFQCDACGGTGLNPETRQIDADWYAFDNPERRWCNNITQDEVEALVNAGRLYDFTHTWTPDGKGWVRRADKYVPTAAEVNAWSRRGMGHDAINRWIAVEARAKRLGVYGKCAACKGEGEIPNPDKKERTAYKMWKPYEPPKGLGYQLWETCSEGSPISPVFPDKVSLATWCETGATIFGRNKMTMAEWLHLFNADDVEAGSMMVSMPATGFIGPAAKLPNKEECK